MVMSSRTATLTSSEFMSDYGWTISLPPGWEKLEDLGAVTLTGFKPVVFSSPKDWSVAITWMRSPRPWTPDVVAGFHQLIAMDGPVPLDDADAFVKTVFGTAGTVTEARTVTLNTGERGLEIIEFIGSGFAPKCGYQMIVAVPVPRNNVALPSMLTGETPSSYFERLVFYSDPTKFGQLLSPVRESCRNFKRTRPNVAIF
jgi:hypothetical protein